MKSIPRYNQVSKIQSFTSTAFRMCMPSTITAITTMKRLSSLNYMNMLKCRTPREYNRYLKVSSIQKFSSSPSHQFSTPEFNFDGIDSSTRAEMQKRHQGIIMNPKGSSQYILPGDYVIKTNQKTGTKKKVSVERSLGYFWTLKDLKDSNNKPILSNDSLIPEEICQMFPALGRDNNLTSLTNETVIFPDYLTKNNRSKDASAQSTLICINFNDFGYKMLPSWIHPYESHFRNDSDRVKVIRLSIHEGRVLSFLKSFIIRSFQSNVAEDKQHNSFTYFGSCAEVRDMLRMHNDKTAYVYLLDGLGRVRFAGSGEATKEEVDLLIELTNQIAPQLKGSSRRNLDTKMNDFSGDVTIRAQTKTGRYARK